MRYLKPYSKLFETVQNDNKFFKTYEETRKWIEKMDIKNFTINQNLTIDIHRNEIVDLRSCNLNFIPVKFGNVNGDFIISNNRLTSLEGCPDFVSGHFEFSDNKISSLKGFPKMNYWYRICYDFNPISEFLFLLKEPDYLLKFIEYLNEYNVIINNKIFLEKLKEILFILDVEKTFDIEGLFDLDDYEIIE